MHLRNDDDRLAFTKNESARMVAVALSGSKCVILVLDGREN